MGRLKTLIHIHTNYSFDSDISIDALAGFARSQGLGCLAVTDHDTIEGARRLADRGDVDVIVGSEVSTRDGHLIGLFLTEDVPRAMSARDTAIAIHEQGGLVLLPHPFVTVVNVALGRRAYEIADFIDAVEVNNAQNVVAGPDRRADAFADELGLAKFVGADTHSVRSIAPCYQIMPEFNGPDDFLQALRSAELIRGRHTFRYFVDLAGRTLLRMFGLPLPRGFGTEFRSELHGDSQRVSVARQRRRGPGVEPTGLG